MRRPRVADPGVERGGTVGRRAWRGVSRAPGAVGGLGGAWVALDALDIVPGVLTLEPVPAPAEPFPTAPGAVELPAVDAVLPDLDPSAPLPDPDTVAAWARALAADPRLGASTSVVVADVLTGDVLADVSGTMPQVPASTAKILTAMATITALGADRTLPTTVVQGEPGELVIVGGGDMMLSEGPGDPDQVVGRAGLVDLAAQVAAALRQQGVTQVSVSLDDTLFSGPGIHPEWVPSDVAAGYVASIAPLAVQIAKTDPTKPYPRRYPDPAMDAAVRFPPLLPAEGFGGGDIA
ncbi:MAG TPA: D-alanyl-D-alanine carboxypeptidase, partial [Actinotalea sp.]|nr:D-alanyl-D-alanine carboxypeptidase [Actinotalea sp.]